MIDRLVEVAPAIPLNATARQTYTYRLTASPAEPLLYRPVRITLGTRRAHGFIISETTKAPSYHLKTAQLVPTAALTTAQVGFAEWLHATQRGGLGYTLRLFSPPPEPLTVSQKKRSLNRPQAIIEGNSPKRWAVLARQLQPYHQKKQPVLIIVPERWLLEPLAAALAEKLACSPLIIHAGLKKSTLVRAVYAVTRYAPLIIGTQKALFLPHPALGAVVLAEENYQTHKLWDQYPRLSNWHGVEQVAALHQAALIYTTSFPSVRLYGRLQTKKIKNIGHLPALPKTHVLSLSFTERQKNYFLPGSLINSMRGWLKEKHVGLIHTLSLGRAKELRHSLYTAFGRSVNLTVGTPSDIISEAKVPYHHLIWLFPETILRYPDYRSREHAYTLLQRFAQLLPGKQSVCLITRFPRQLEQELLISPTDYFEQELKARQRLSYPPFAEVVRLTIADRTPKRAAAAAAKVRQQLESHVFVRGPLAALHNTKPERHLILRGSLPDLTSQYRHTKITSADLDPFRIL